MNACRDAPLEGGIPDLRIGWGVKPDPTDMQFSTMIEMTPCIRKVQIMLWNSGFSSRTVPLHSFSIASDV